MILSLNSKLNLRIYRDIKEFIEKNEVGYLSEERKSDELLQHIL